MIWFTSDEHHLHHNIIDYCGRPYKNDKEMSNSIIDKHNQLVMPGDTVYHIGDWSMASHDKLTRMEKLFRKYNDGVKRYLILGNHDLGKHKNINPFRYIDIGFHSVHTSLTIEYHRVKIVMNHDPSIYQIVADNFDVLICGHVHGLFDLLPGKCISINVGVDVRDFKPVSVEEVLDRYLEFVE